MRGVFDCQRADVAEQRAEMQAEMSRREREAANKARLQLENELLRKEIAVAEKRQTDMQLSSPLPATAQLNVYVDRMSSAATGALQSAPGDTHTLTSANSHAQQSPTTDSVNPSTVGAFVQPTAATRDAHLLALSAPAPAPADTQHATLPALDSLMLDHTVGMRSGSDDMRPPPPLQPDSKRAAPAPGAIVDHTRAYQQLTDNALMSAPAPLMTDYAPPLTMSDMTAASLQLGLPRVPSCTPALTTYSSMYAVDVDRASPTMNSSQFSTMTARTMLNLLQS